MKSSSAEKPNLTAECLHNLDVEETSWENCSKLITYLWKFGKFPHRYQSLMYWVTNHLDNCKISEQLWTLTSVLLADDNFHKSVEEQPEEKIISVRFVKKYIEKVKAVKVEERHQVTRLLILGKMLFQFEALAKEFKSKNFDLCSQFTAAWITLLYKLKEDEVVTSLEHEDDVMVFVTSLMRNNLDLLHKSKNGSAVKTFFLNWDILFLPTMQLMKYEAKLSRDLKQILLVYYQDGVFNKSFEFLHEPYAHHDPNRVAPPEEKHDPPAADHHHRRIHEKIKMAAEHSATSLLTYFRCLTSSKLNDEYLFKYLVKLCDMMTGDDVTEVDDVTIVAISQMMELMIGKSSGREEELEFYANFIARFVNDRQVTPATCRLVHIFSKMNFQRLVEVNLATIFRNLNTYYVTHLDCDVSTHVDELFAAMTSSFHQVMKIVTILIGSVENEDSISIRLIDSFAVAMTSHIHTWPYNLMMDVWENVQNCLQPALGNKSEPPAKMARLENGLATSGATEHKLEMLSELLRKLLEKLPLPRMRQESIQQRVREMMTQLSAIVTSYRSSHKSIWLKLLLACDAEVALLRHYDNTGKFKDLKLSHDDDDLCNEMICIMMSKWKSGKEEGTLLSGRALQWLLGYYWTRRYSSAEKGDGKPPPTSASVLSAINVFLRDLFSTASSDDDVIMTRFRSDVYRHTRSMFYALQQHGDVDWVAVGDVMQSIDDVTRTATFYDSDAMQLVIVGKMWKQFCHPSLGDVVARGELAKLDKLFVKFGQGVVEEDSVKLYARIRTILADFISAHRKKGRTFGDQKIPTLEKIAEILESRIQLTNLKSQAAMSSLLMTSLLMITTNGEKMTSSLHERFVVAIRHLLVSNTKTNGISTILPFEQMMEILINNYEKYERKDMVDDVIAVLTRTSLSTRHTHLVIKKYLKQKSSPERSTLVRHLVFNITSALVEGNSRFNVITRNSAPVRITVEWWKAMTSRVDLVTSSSTNDVTSYCREQLQTLASSLDGEFGTTTSSAVTSSLRESSFVADFGLGVASWKLDGEKSFDKLRQKIQLFKLTTPDGSMTNMAFLRIYYDVIVFLTQLGHQVELDSGEWRKMVEFLLASGQDGCGDILVLLLILHPNVEALNDLFSAAISCLNVKNVQVTASLKLVHLVALCYDKRKKNFRNLKQEEKEEEVDEDAEEKEVSEGVKISLKFLRDSFDAISQFSKSCDVTSELLCESMRILSQLITIGTKLITSGQICGAFHSLVNVEMTSSTDNRIFAGVYDVLNGIVVNHKSATVNMTSSVLSVIRRLLNFIMKNSRKEGIEDLCEYLQRICHLIAAQYPTYYKKKCCYLLVDYIYGISTGQVHPPVKESLTSSMYEVMSICDDENKKILEMTQMQLDAQFRDVFSKFRQDYNKYFKYSGRV